MASLNPSQISLAFAGITIRQDGEGRYCLNDLHKAAGKEPRHKPSSWLRLSHAKALVSELTEAGNPAPEKSQPVRIFKGGRGMRGTFVCKELVYAYAMWLSPRFELKVSRALDERASQPPVPDPMRILLDPVVLRELLLTYDEKVIGAPRSLATTP